MTFLTPDTYTRTRKHTPTERKLFIPVPVSVCQLTDRSLKVTEVSTALDPGPALAARSRVPFGSESPSGISEPVGAMAL